MLHLFLSRMPDCQGVFSDIHCLFWKEDGEFFKRGDKIWRVPLPLDQFPPYLWFLPFLPRNIPVLTLSQPLPKACPFHWLMSIGCSKEATITWLTLLSLSGSGQVLCSTVPHFAGCTARIQVGCEYAFELNSPHPQLFLLDLKPELILSTCYIAAYIICMVYKHAQSKLGPWHVRRILKLLLTREPMEWSNSNHRRDLIQFRVTFEKKYDPNSDFKIFF